MLDATLREEGNVSDTVKETTSALIRDAHLRARAMRVRANFMVIERELVR